MKLNKIEMITGKLICVTGLHIGGGETGMHSGGTDNPVIKTNQQGKMLPYIPGSSLKGKIRSLLELYKGEDDQEIKLLFGSKLPKEPSFTRLFFWDCFLSEEWQKQLEEQDIPATEVKMENSINRITGKATDPRMTERVISGSTFHFKLTFKKYESDQVRLETVLKGLKLLEYDSLGGSGSRGYGKVRFEDLKLDGQSIEEQYKQLSLF